MYDEERFAPRKINVEQLKEGLPSKQMDRLNYECMLVGVSIKELLQIASHLFRFNETTEKKPETYPEDNDYYTYNSYGDWT